MTAVGAHDTNRRPSRPRPKAAKTVELPVIASPGSLIAIANEPTIFGLPSLNQFG
jgi:hypothetical protein